MASNLLKLSIQKINTPIPSNLIPLSKTLGSSLSISLQQQERHYHISFSSRELLRKSRNVTLSLQSSLSPFPNPPTSKEEAILQAKTCLSCALEKPLNNPRLAGKLKKQKQPRFRVEIPVVNDSAESLVQLALDVFGDLRIRRKGTPSKTLLIWSNPVMSSAATQAFASHSLNQVANAELSTIANDDTGILNSADVAVFLAPEASQLDVMKGFTEGLYPKPVVIFNPMWGLEEEDEMGELKNFVGSFEVVYSFMGLEVRGVFSKRKGVVFKCVRDGVLSGEKWTVWVEEEAELKMVSSFKKRPSIGEVENVLYNLIAINSPVTKSAKFLRDLVSNVTGKKRV